MDMEFCIYRYDIECDCYPDCKGCIINPYDQEEVEEDGQKEG